MKRSRLSQISDSRKAALTRYRALSAELKKVWTHCARCGLASNQLDAHHPFKRGKGKFAWKLFVVVPLCRWCHTEIHDNENRAREDGWLVDPKFKNPFEIHEP